MNDKELRIDTALAGIAKFTEITNEIQSIDKRMTYLRQELATLDKQRSDALRLMSALVHVDAEYYTIDRRLLGHQVVSHTIKDEHDMETALDYFRHDGYYTSQTTVLQLVLGLNVLNKLAMLHDLYCPDYTPDSDFDEPVYTVALQNNKWVPSRVQLHRMLNTIYYPNSDVAQHVCDYLNAIKYMLEEDNNDTDT